MFPHVRIQIVSYNGGEILGRCLKSVFALDYPDFSVTVIDNASMDNSITLVRENFPSVNLIANDKNLGFGSGHNIGFHQALDTDAKYVWLLNQDAWVAPDSLTRLVEHAQATDHFGATSPLILNTDDSIWFTGGHIDWLRMRTVHADSSPTEYLSGCALFISSEALRQVGLFDERFFLYYEDADLSLRLRQAGFSLSIAPQSRVWHAETSNTDTPAKTYWLVLSGLTFFHKHASGPWRLWHNILTPLRCFKNRLDVLLHPNPLNQAVARAYADFHSSLSSRA